MIERVTLLAIGISRRAEVPHSIYGIILDFLC